MKSTAQLFAMRNLSTLVLLLGAVALSAQEQGNDKMMLKLAKTAIEKYGDFEQAEKYLSQISTDSRYRDSADFLIMDAKVNTSIADKAKTPKPDNYKKAIEDYEKLYSLKNNDSITDIIADLKYKYDKSKEKQLQNVSNPETNDTADMPPLPVPTGKYLAKSYTVLHKPAWHVGINAGFGFDYFSYAAQQTTYSQTTLNNAITDSSSASATKYNGNPGMGLKFGLVIHPYISDHVAVGIHADGEVGTTHLIFVGGGNLDRTSSGAYTSNTKYFYGNFNYGIEVTAGFAWFKVLAAYDHSLRHADLSYYEYRYSGSDVTGGREVVSQSGQYKMFSEWRHEELTFGMRLFPYSKDKLRIKNPCLLDLAYTLNRDYDFAWKSTIWNYRGINSFYHGVKVKLWVESILGVTAHVSFPKNYFKTKGEPVNIQSTKLLPFIGVSLFYNIDFFGLGY